VRLVHFADDAQPLTELSDRACIIEFFTLNYLWLLSRTAHPSKATLKHIESRAAEMGYGLKMLKWTEQP
jgi:hypothetical protein